MVTSHVVKRSGQIEQYARDKLARSVIAACLSVRTPEGAAEMNAEAVCNITEKWLAIKPEVTSADIRRKAAEALELYNSEAAYIYKQHQSIS